MVRAWTCYDHIFFFSDFICKEKRSDFFVIRFIFVQMLIGWQLIHAIYSFSCLGNLSTYRLPCLWWTTHNLLFREVLWLPPYRMSSYSSNYSYAIYFACTHSIGCVYTRNKWRMKSEIGPIRLSRSMSRTKLSLHAVHIV